MPLRPAQLSVDGYTGLHSSDINQIIMAYLNALVDPVGGGLNVGNYFEPVGAMNSSLSVASAQVLTPPAGASKIMIGTATQNCRYSLDGSTPTATVGFLLSTAFPPVLIGITPSTILTVIQVAGTAVFTYQWGK